MCKKPKETEKQQKKTSFHRELSILLPQLCLKPAFFYFHVLHRGGIVMPIIDWRL